MPQPDLTDQDRDALAGELALGIIEGEERAAALRLMLSDPAFAAQVDGWRMRTAGLFDAIDDVTPPAGSWDAIAARIAVRPAPVAANDRWWKAGTFASMAVAAALALALILPSETAPLADDGGEYAVAQLTGEIDGLRIAARYDPESAMLKVHASGMPSTQTEPELWLVPADGVPRSLGQIARDGATVMPVAQDHRPMIAPGAVFGITMEPRSVTPHAAPSSPIVASSPIDLI